MINLELTNGNEQKLIDINRFNNILVSNYNGFMNFYNCFYESLIKKNKEYKIRLSNKSLDSKNTVMLDFTSVYNILSSLEYRKGTLLYEYMVSKYSYVDSLGYDRIYELYMDIQNTLNENDNGVFYDIVNDLNKLLYEGIELSYDKEDIFKVFEKILKDYLNKYYNKTIIIFIDSDIVDINLELYEYIYYFDISVSKNIESYNLISYDNVRELDFNIIKNYIYNRYPLSLNINLIDKIIKMYYRYYYKDNEINAYSEEEMIVFTLLSKENNIKRTIIPKNFIISDNIKSFLALL